MPASTVTKDYERCRLIVEREFAAPADLVWACWTQADRLRMWWGPSGWLVDIFELDVRPGGVWRYRLRPEAEHELDDEQWGRAIYRVVDAPHRLEFVDSFADASGALIVGTEMPTTVLIDQSHGATSVSITVAFTGTEQLDEAEALGMVEGFTDAFERLATALAASG
ncbi:SRPBCC family protein [Agromyces neolithicus]|uniref:SRPBCC family protein n=1 Tax=Agromyces neolithicus TaxID=269420 RepID=A0ABN2M0Z1_9MICO